MCCDVAQLSIMCFIGAVLCARLLPVRLHIGLSSYFVYVVLHMYSVKFCFIYLG